MARKILKFYPSTCQEYGSIGQCIYYYCDVFDCQNSQMETLIKRSCSYTHHNGQVTSKSTSICDDRETLENLFTDFLFVCPLKYLAATQVNQAFFYNFKAPAPLDLSYIPGLATIDRCSYLACHTAEINYQLEVDINFWKTRKNVYPIESLKLKMFLIAPSWKTL